MEKTKLTAKQVSDRIAEVFEQYGQTVYEYGDGWDNNFSSQEVYWIKNEMRATIYDEEQDEIEFDIYDFAAKLCAENNLELPMYSVNQVFDSPGLDIYVLSFVIYDKETDTYTYSFNNIHERY